MPSIEPQVGLRRREMGPMTSIEPWQELLTSIADDCRAVGFWSGEARRLRDAHGAKRMGPRIVEAIASRLARSGYDLDECPSFEGDPVLVTPAGTKQLAAQVLPLLADLRALDGVIPRDLPWRDDLVACRAVGRWLARRNASVDTINGA